MGGIEGEKKSPTEVERGEESEQEITFEVCQEELDAHNAHRPKNKRVGTLSLKNMATRLNVSQVSILEAALSDIRIATLITRAKAMTDTYGKYKRAAEMVRTKRALRPEDPILLKDLCKEAGLTWSVVRKYIDRAPPSVTKTLGIILYEPKPSGKTKRIRQTSPPKPPEHVYRNYERAIAGLRAKGQEISLRTIAISLNMNELSVASVLFQRPALMENNPTLEKEVREFHRRLFEEK